MLPFLYGLVLLVPDVLYGSDYFLNEKIHFRMRVGKSRVSERISYVVS